MSFSARFFRASFIAAGALCASLGSSVVWGQDNEFYANKQMRLVIGTGVGGGYDLTGRLVGRHIFRHIPGQPRIVFENMPGASSLVAANYIYNIAPKDGSVLAAFVQSLPLDQVLEKPNAKYDSSKFHWIGTPRSDVNVIVTWHTSPVKTIEDALRMPTILGVTTLASSGGLDVALVNNVVGTKFRMVAGYQSGSEIDLAMERGEVMGRSGQSWGGYKAIQPEWIQDKKLNVLVQGGLARSKDLPDVPLMTDLAKSQEQKQIIGLLSDSIGLGWPLALGPGVPPARVATLRAAFRATMSDPEFLKDAERLQVSIEPVYGEELQDVVARMISTPRSVVELAKSAMTYKEPAER